MKPVTCKRYEVGSSAEWNSFAATCKNTHFMFQREFMDYHSDRFEDHSLLFHQDGQLAGLLPANLSQGVLHSHQGLTFGGLLIQQQTTALQVMEMLESLLLHLRSIDARKFVYKPMPHIFHRYMAQEDLFALTLKGATLVSRDLSSALPIGGARLYTKGKKSNLSKARRNGIVIRETDAFLEFHGLLHGILQARHGLSPVHSAAELQLLGNRFPSNIRLFGAFINSEMVSGALLFLNPPVVHSQYLANSDRGRECGALDFLIDHLITEQFQDQRFFSFGISTKHGGTNLNVGLLESKESFGARALVHDVYELSCRKE